jgi:hypothetical protein
MHRQLVQSIPLDDADMECLTQGLWLVTPCTQRFVRLIDLLKQFRAGGRQGTRGPGERRAAFRDAHPGRATLLQVVRQVPLHLEHRHLAFPEDRLELFMSQDLATIIRVPKIMPLDVVTRLTICAWSKGSEPTMAVNSFGGRTGFCRADFVPRTAPRTKHLWFSRFT